MSSPGAGPESIGGSALGARRIAIVASSSGQGKTTFGRRLGRLLEVPFLELDGWVHGPGWTEVGDAELIARLEPVLAMSEWIVDGAYLHKVGWRVLDAAELIIWFDLPMRVWLPRLLRRSLGRVIRRSELWNGNRESWRGAFGGRGSLVGYALINHRSRRELWRQRLAGRPLIRITSDAEARALLEGIVLHGRRAGERGTE